MHGGSSLVGPAHPSWKTGEQSRYKDFLPSRLADKYQAAVNDPELLALRDDIALTDARLADVLRRVDTGESGELWGKLQVAHAEIRAAMASGNAQALIAAVTEMGQLVSKGISDYATWDEVGKLLEQRRRLVESERRRLVDMQQMVTASQLVVYTVALLEAVKQAVGRNVDDEKQKHAILGDAQRAFDRLVSISHHEGSDR